MAGSNRKDVELAFRVSTPGGDSVNKLGEDVHGLAAEGAGLGKAFSGADEQLAALAQRTREARDAQKAAAAELRNAQQELRATRDDLDRLKASYKASGGDVAAYRQSVGQLELKLVDARAALRAKKDATTEAAAAAKAAAMAEKAFGDQVRKSAADQADAAKTIGGSLKEIGAQLAVVRNLAAATFGGQILAGAVGDVARTADAFNDLGARIKLVTGDGANFQQAFAGIFEVAQRTNTSLETTGTLFARVAQAGKAIGVGAQEALRLTEEINQAVQVGGASADASDAAITQLIQGLQSGVLRGDEFNSVMEQAPRLAQALADGLGVTTGELRKMAEAGKLTSATVIGALQGQAQVVQAEFEKLPATVGRAITNLSTAWTEYVGEVDQANGISAKAAGAINILAQNLGTLGTLLLDAGKGFAAYKALRLAETLFSEVQAMAASTAATAANTAAVIENTAAKRANAVAGDAAASGVTRFGAAMSSLKIGAFALLAVNIKDAGTAIGEGIAKLAGYGRMIENAEAAERGMAAASREAAAAKAALAQKLQLAADKALGLTAESRKLVDEFEGLRLKGESTAESLEKLQKNLRIGDIKGITDAGAALDALGLKGELTAAQIRDSWTKALKDVDLGVFEAQARAAFDGSEQGARRLAAALDGALRESIRRTGLDFNLISGGMGAAAQSALNDLDLIVSRLGTLQASGIQTGELLARSIGRAIDNADSQRAIDSVKVQIEGIRKVLGDKIADGFLDQAAAKALELKDAAEKALPGVQSLREAYKLLGIQAPEDLARVATANKAAWETIKADGNASSAVLQAAFARYAQSILDSTGASGRAMAQELLRAEGAAKGLSVEFDNAGRIIVRGASDAIERIGRMGDAFDKTTRSIQKQSEALTELYNRNRILIDQSKTADGFQKNADGAAAGTFDNTLPVDQAFKLANGQITDLVAAKAAFQQAQNAYNDMQAFIKNSPGSASPEYIRSTQQLYTKARAELDKLQAPTLGGTRTQTPGTLNSVGGTRTVNVNIGGKVSSVNVASQQDSDALVGMLRQLETASQASA